MHEEHRDWELDEDYPLAPDEVDTTHDLSAGLRRHWPECYDELGRYHEREMSYWPALFVVAGLVLIARIVL